MPRRTPTLAEYRTLAELRRAMRRFLAFSHEAAVAAGLPPRQHQALLSIKGWPEPDGITISGLADHLALKHHSAVGLVDRLVRRGLVRRRVSRRDRRRVELELTRQGEALIARLSVAHLDELARTGPELRRILGMLPGRDD
ncbi:MarR family transcriptional regulator [Oleiharenicola sp. Vm1]|uniref:MarR family transcriptional regulator n=1 Tax=Oleiharenicola sp. Vm1 TaxID=3398393 RepID=UPI0039F6421D